VGDVVSPVDVPGDGAGAAVQAAARTSTAATEQADQNLVMSST
jgi:hypothetical protein